jgi:hypothetical protein
MFRIIIIMIVLASLTIFEDDDSYGFTAQDFKMTSVLRSERGIDWLKNRFVNSGWMT